MKVGDHIVHLASSGDGFLGRCRCGRNFGFADTRDELRAAHTEHRIDLATEIAEEAENVLGLEEHVLRIGRLA